jgi:hypothetical protein
LETVLAPFSFQKQFKKDTTEDKSDLKTSQYDEWTNATALQKNEVNERCRLVLEGAQASSVFHYHLKAFLDYCSRNDNESMLDSTLQTVDLIVHCLCEDLHFQMENKASQEVRNIASFQRKSIKMG